MRTIQLKKKENGFRIIKRYDPVLGSVNVTGYDAGLLFGGNDEPDGDPLGGESSWPSISPNKPCTKSKKP